MLQIPLSQVLGHDNSGTGEAQAKGTSTEAALLSASFSVLGQYQLYIVLS
jgi:hypothetical protein